MTPPSATAKRYFVRAAAAFVAYALLSAGVVWLSRVRPRPPLWMTAPAALLPALAVLAAVFATARYFRDETDPVQRAIQVEALVWAIGVTFGVATAWGFLEALAGAPGVPSYCAFAVFSSVVASVQLSRRLFPNVLLRRS